jgi:hypothetical protein
MNPTNTGQLGNMQMPSQQQLPPAQPPTASGFGPQPAAQGGISGFLGSGLVGGGGAQPPGGGWNGGHQQADFGGGEMLQPKGQDGSPLMSAQDPRASFGGSSNPGIVPQQPQTPQNNNFAQRFSQLHPVAQQALRGMHPQMMQHLHDTGMIHPEMMGHIQGGGSPMTGNML